MDRIEIFSKPEDSMGNEVLGHVFRVPVLCIWEAGVKCKSINDEDTARPIKRRRIAAPSLPPAPAE